MTDFISFLSLLLHLSSVAIIRGLVSLRARNNWRDLSVTYFFTMYCLVKSAEATLRHTVFQFFEIHHISFSPRYMQRETYKYGWRAT